MRWTAPAEQTALARILCALGRRLFHRGHDLIEGRRVGGSHIGEYLAVQADLGLRQPVDERAIAQAALADGRVDANDPQLAEIALAASAVAKGIHPRADQRFL